MKRTITHFSAPKFSVLTLTGLLALASFSARAETTSLAAPHLELSTQETLIRKLELVVGEDLSGVDQVNTAIRLADLYSEHARQIEFASKGETPKDQQEKIDHDRRRALQIYTEIFEKLQGDAQAKALLQRAYLHQNLREGEKAEALYSDVIQHSKKYAPLLQAEAHLQRGEIEFTASDFKKAQADFEAAYNSKTYPRRGYALYKRAWCRFNLGDNKQAESDLAQLLGSNALLSATRKDGVHEIDRAFQAEASHDYATIMSHRPVSIRDIEHIKRVTPEADRTANLTYLAQELDRTGQKSSALLIWNELGTQPHQSDEDRLEGQVKITRIQYDLGKKANVVVEMKKTIELWRKEGCDEAARCQELQGTLKKLLKDWNTAEEVAPTHELIETSQVYLSMFTDPVMSFLTARSAEHGKFYAQAFLLYKQSAEWAAQLRGKIADKTSSKNNDDLLNNALLAEIGAAESSHDTALKLQSYTHYLHYNSDGAKAFEVKYQIAQLSSEAKNYKDAADQFHTLAVSAERKQNPTLAIKAADLSLDNLASLHDDETILKWSPELAEIYPERHAEYAKISRNAALNLAARTINDDKSSDGALVAELARLKAIRLDGASDEEKLAVYKHRAVIARRVHDLGELDRSSASILVLHKVSADEKDRARETLAWSSEVQLKFKDALYWHKQIQHPKASASQEALKRGLLAELAHENSESYYAKYFETTAPSATTAAVAYNLVLASPRPQRTVEQYRHQLHGDPAVFAQAIVWAGLKSNDQRWTQRELASAHASGTPIGSEFIQFAKGEEAWTTAFNQSSPRLDGTSDSRLKRTLHAAQSSIQHLEQQVSSAQMRDQSLVTMIKLAVLLRANQELATGIMHLPIPGRLNRGQKVQYRMALAQQAQPYQDRAREINTKLGEIVNTWAGSTKVGSSTRDPHSLLAAQELKLVTAIAKKSRIPLSQYSTDAGNVKVLTAARKSAEDDLKRNPFSASSMARLMEIEQQLGDRAMVMEIAARVAETKEKVQ